MYIYIYIQNDTDLNELQGNNTKNHKEKQTTKFFSYYYLVLEDITTTDLFD